MNQKLYNNIIQIFKLSLNITNYLLDKKYIRNKYKIYVTILTSDDYHTNDLFESTNILYIQRLIVPSFQKKI